LILVALPRSEAFTLMRPDPSGAAMNEFDIQKCADYVQAMDKRQTILETRLDVILPTLATKADLLALQARIDVLNAKHDAEIQTMHATIATLATKQELAIMQAKMETAIAQQTTKINRLFVGVTITLVFSFIGSTFTVLGMLGPL
jgi:hypothetical protein